MADRTVRAVFEAQVDKARKGMRDLSTDVDKAGKKVDTLTKDLSALDKQSVSPDVDVKIDEAKKRLSDVKLELADLEKLEATPEVTAKIDDAKKRMTEIRGEIRSLQGEKAEFRITAATQDAERKVRDITRELGDLRTMEVTPEVTARITEAQKNLRTARSELRELRAAKATMTVDADISPAQDEFDKLGDAGDEAGDEAGENIVSGILSALQTIPIAGAVIGVGVAIAGGILLGVKQGLAIEAERDLFSAQTGLDEDTAARFGRAAGEAYAQAWGESVADNLDVARRALQAGIIDETATDREIENVIAKLQGIQTLFDMDISMAVQGVGNLMKTGLVRDANQAFDLIVAAQQKLPSDDLLDTLNEYSNQFVTIGLTAEEAFGLIVQGAQAGARDTDKVADTLKEMGLRIREGTDPAIEALETLGLNQKQIVEDFQEGGPAAAAAMDQVFDALRVLKDEGGNTQEVIAALFGGPGEDLGAALFALDLDTVAEALGGVDGAAGAADRALATMADNAATKIEEAKRGIEIAMDGIKGALAEAFSDEITGAAEWVSRNRAPLMEFFLMVINGAFEMGIAFVDFSATALEALASFAEQAAGILQFLPGFSLGDKKALEEEAAGLRDFAGTMREDWTGALEDMQARANEWAGPEILKARQADALAVMIDDLDAFQSVIDQTGGTITINGDTVNAQEAVDLLLENVNAEDGTVTINGDALPAEDVLDRLIVLIGQGEEDVTVGADDSPARENVRGLMADISTRRGSVTVGADTSPAEARLRELTRKRYMEIGVRVAGVTGMGGLMAGSHSGGRLPGRYTGGWVPGSDPGYDNILWPLNMGGRTLQQPLAGGEYVVNSRQADVWGPLLEWINSGGQPGSGTQTNSYPVNVERMITYDAADIRRKADRERKIQATARGPV